MTKPHHRPSNAYAALNRFHHGITRQDPWPYLEAYAHTRYANAATDGKLGTMIPLRDGPGGLLLLDDLPANFDGQIWLLPRKPAQVLS